MSRSNRIFFIFMTWMLLEILIFAAVAEYMNLQVKAHTIFHFPYSMYFVGLIRGYWWIPLVSLPLLCWLTLRWLEYSSQHKDL